MKKNYYLNVKNDVEFCSSFLIDTKSASLSFPVSKNPLDILRNKMEEAIDKSLENKFYLSSIPPGRGKSRLVKEAVAQWVDDGTLKGEGVLIALSTKEEIEAYTGGWGISPHQYAALTSDPVINKFGAGSGRATEVPILLTTHQMIRTRLKDRLFEDADCFYFKGRARALRIWDEGLLPAEPVSLRIDDLKALASKFRSSHSGFISELEHFLTDLSALSVGDVARVPASIGTVAASISKAGAASGFNKQILETLSLLSGRLAEIGQENRRGLTLVGCGPRLPDDLAPLFILDGSGDIRATYNRWKASRDNIVRLPAIAVDHSPMAIHLWQKGCGREIMRGPKDRQPILDAIVKQINDHSDEEWLIVYRKEEEDDLPELLKPHLMKPENVRFRHWGLHHGTNIFRKIKNLIVIGSNAYAETAYDSCCYAASGGDPDGTAKDFRKEMRFGETCHHLRQAIYRGNARNHSDDTCGECRIYLINSYHDIKRALDVTFPGCKVDEWMPCPRKPRDWERARDEIIGVFRDPCRLSLSKKDVTEKLGISKQQATRIWKNENLVNALKSGGIVIESKILIRSTAPAL